MVGVYCRASRKYLCAVDTSTYVRADASTCVTARMEFLLGALLLAFSIVEFRRVPTIDHELRQHALEDIPVRPWPSEPLTAYRPAGWPLLSRLRRTRLLAYPSGVLGIALIMRAL